ncbi:ribonuclease H-like domain-containing protein [Chloroflexota bacterium]
MPSLSEKLKALGVNIGTDGLVPTSKSTKYPIEQIIDGQEVNTPFGQTFVVEKTYLSDPRSEKIPLRFSASMATLSTWIGDPKIVQYKPESFAFLDTETSGLAGGSGTYVFMIGIGRFTNDEFRLTQFFMRDPIEEPAQLAAVLGALDGCKVLVTYNGKSFDVPLINSRFITNGEPPPLKSHAHIDLLHIARRLWRDRLPSRTLGSIEENILEFLRTEEDIPGWMVPSIYFDYIKTGDARPLNNVFYHNAMDILSLATLLNHISAILDDPHGGLVEHGIDLIAIGKIYEDIREIDAAAECFARGLELDIPRKVRGQAIQRWSLIEKRRNNIDISIRLWQNAAEYEEIYAHVELAKAFEHRLRDYSQAIFWTERAIAIIQSPGFSDIERIIWESQLSHRLDRLMRKFERSK